MTVVNPLLSAHAAYLQLAAQLTGPMGFAGSIALKKQAHINGPIFSPVHTIKTLLYVCSYNEEKHLAIESVNF